MTPDIKTWMLVIYNISGQKMMEQPLQESNTEINTSNLAAAVYIVKITNENKTMDVRKITIEKN